MSELFPQAAELEYLGVLLMTEKRLEQETHAQISAASALLRILKKERSTLRSSAMATSTGY